MQRKKILIIAGVIYPRISPRSFRATELAKEFARQGHEVILAAQLGSYNYTDFETKYNLKVENIGVSKFARIISDGKINLPIWKKGLIYLFGKILEFPDILLIPRVKKYLSKKENFDLIISIAIPYPIHWGVASFVKKNKNFDTWVSDCGDPFMGNSVTKPPFYFKYLEDNWGRLTDYITVPVEDAKTSYSLEVQNKIRVIPQGFNFEEVRRANYVKNAVPTFIYAGAFYPEKRDPRAFLEFLKSCPNNFKFIIYTGNASLVSEYQSSLKEKLEIRDPLDRESLMYEMSKADFLINIRNEGTIAQVPSKLIDYGLTYRPILDIGSAFVEEEQQKFNDFLRGDYLNSLIISNLEDYNIENIANKFLNL